MKKKLGMLALIMAFWFTISFITNILGPLIPDIIHNFNLSDLAMAGFIPTSFFIAYAIMSIPAGLMIDRFGEKPVLFLGFLMPFIGTTLFACIHTYPILLASSFIIGLGMAMLQTVLNPLQRTVGGEENYAFIAELAQFMFGIASFLSPLVYTYLIHELNPDIYKEGKNFFIDLLAGMTPADMPWVSLYWVFTLLLLVMLIAVVLSRFPKIELKEDEKSGSKDFLHGTIQAKIRMVVFPRHLLLCKYGTGNFHLYEYIPRTISRSEPAGRRCASCKLFLGINDCRMFGRHGTVEID